MENMILDWVSCYNLKNTKEIRRKREFVNKCKLFVQFLEGKILTAYSRETKATAKVQLRSTELSILFGSNAGIGYKKVISCLADLNIVCTGSSYLAGEFSKKYWFGGAYHHIEDVVSLTPNNYNETELYLYHCVKRLSFDKQKIEVYIAGMEFNSAVAYNNLILNYFKSNKCFVKQDVTNRLHSNLTMLPRRYRSIISYEGKYLSDVDLANAQPFLLIPLANQHNLPLDEAYVEDACSGDLYVNILAKIKSKNIRFDSSTLKKQLFTYLFFAKKRPTKNYKSLTAFENLYPLTYDTIHKLKDKLGNSGLAIQLQSLESKLMNSAIDKLKTKFKDNIFLRFHDAILCQKELEMVLKTEIQDTSLRLFNVFPQCRISEFKSNE